MRSCVVGAQWEGRALSAGQNPGTPFCNLCVVVLYCTPSGILFTIMSLPHPPFFPQEEKNHEFSADLIFFVYFFVLMMDLKAEDLKGRTGI